MRFLLKRLRDNLVNSLLISLFISAIVIFSTVNDFVEKESVKFQSIKNSFIGNKSNLILLGMLTEEAISHSNTEQKQSRTAMKGSSAIYRYGVTNIELSEQEMIVYETMSRVVSLVPQSIETNVTVLYRSFKSRKLFSTRAFNDLVLEEEAFSPERCKVTGTCSLNATKNQLIDRVVVSPIYQDLLSNRITLSITTPVYYSGEIIGEYLVDMYLDGEPILEDKEISTQKKGVYKATIIEELDYPFSDFSYVLEFITDNRSLLIYKIPFIKLVVDTLWINGIIFCFVFTLLWKVNELGVKQEKLKDAERVATSDELTGLYNRTIFRDDSFKQVVDKYALSIIAIDGNKIKAINDTYGHAVGDEAIKHIAACMKRIFRESDYLIRTGGDEFLALLPNCNMAVAVILAEKLNDAVSSSRVAFSHIKVSVSAGVVEQHIGETLESAIGRADSELYKEKNNNEESNAPMEKNIQLS
ncbi:diguanylate cyclase (GGDEF)-like protein [Vibrio crassostreae]|uniref:GGDEF domain-containing protein n=1 Tax=Vibrio crassostreae TaxID=246167 RepID=UPI000F470686|nr:GGDEF domain-containing protein [Vibrio crassostreae]ROO67531.1 diguanylate cyclase (GGDEF)-like protein [Vibrio crassostreae]ROP13108.1 diguanylate cyclase (GGDEF)-like protein [Vibrio crassostreae]ROQ87183.1 diguanylate cyclase (GGDEF)-like protein [Vibrio crassostreae]ROR88446.1 diguanylate cyclase (GGDEF)-like protein [Vibrio crassostreae]RPE89980.1 diguanylate cyclase (GGDEF)-like protein [Vibrio crassostreae]